MTDKKDFTPQEYESIIEELRKENVALKNRIAELENRDTTLIVEQESIKEAPTPVAETETSEPMKKEEIIPIEQQKEIIVSESIFSQNVAPLEMGKGQILQGLSRRECPKCGNKSKPLIRETLDRTHLICDYPRMYGKKYHCGECGVEWRVPVEM